MNKAKTEFNWRVGRGFALSACLAGSLSAGSLARAQGAPASQAKAQDAPASQARSQGSFDSQAKAQTAPAAQALAPNFRLLNAKEGRSIVHAAKDQEQAGRDAQDCSHLVHQTDLAPGFEDPYATSFAPPHMNRNFQGGEQPQP